MWQPPADEEIKPTWQPPADELITDQQQSSTPEPGLFEKATNLMSNAADRISGTMPYAAGLMAPTLGLGYKAAEQMNNASGRLGQSVAEASAEGRTVPSWVPGIGGKRIPPVSAPYAAALGTVASIASNPMTYADPGAGLSGRIAEPVVPVERAFDVATGKKYGLPMTRADMTGGVGASRIETGLSGTVTGGGPFQKLAEQKLSAIESAKNQISSRFGTSEPPSSSGLEAKLSMQAEMGQASKLSRQLYKDVPDVSIPTSNLQKAIDELDFRNLDKSASSTISEIKGRIENQQSPNETFSPTYSVQDANRQAPTFQKLNDVRNLMSKEIQSDTTYNPIIGNQVGPKAQALIPLKKALDADLRQFSDSANTPYGTMEANQFNTSFNKANSFYGNFKNLQNNKMVQKLSRVPESDIPKTVFGSGRVEDINVAKAALGQKGFNAAKRQFFNDLLDQKNVSGKLDKYEPEFLNAVFNKDEMNALREADSLNKTAKTAERMAGNPSGTAQRLASYTTIGALVDSIWRAIANPIHGAAEAGLTLGVPYLGAKAYLGTTHGVPVSFGQGSMAATRVANAPAMAQDKRGLLEELVRRLTSRRGGSGDQAGGK